VLHRAHQCASYLQYTNTWYIPLTRRVAQDSLVHVRIGFTSINNELSCRAQLVIRIVRIVRVGRHTIRSMTSSSAFQISHDAQTCKPKLSKFTSAFPSLFHPPASPSPPSQLTTCPGTPHLAACCGSREVLWQERSKRFWSRGDWPTRECGSASQVSLACDISKRRCWAPADPPVNTRTACGWSTHSDTDAETKRCVTTAQRVCTPA
jgi:hypothetical protein